MPCVPLPPKDAPTIAALFDGIAHNYDRLNTCLSLGRHHAMKREFVKNLALPVHAQALDVCTGTGDIVGLLQRARADVVGVDLSANMLALAAKKHPEAQFLQADCTALPFAANRFDVCTVSFGLRNTADMALALQEIHRVLKPGGVFMNLDLGKPYGPLRLVFRPLLYGWAMLVGRVFHKDAAPYAYLAASNENFPAQKDLVKLVEQTGFVAVRQKNFMLGQIAFQRFYKKG